MHPNQPGWLQLVECDGLAVAVAEAMVDEGAAVAPLVVEVVVGSLHPNQPGVLQVEVVAVDVLVLILVFEVVVVSSRQPHQPGVLHVVVRVLVLVLEVVVELVVLSEPLLSKYFHRKQSLHSLSGTQFGTFGYFLITSSMTT